MNTALTKQISFFAIFILAGYVIINIFSSSGEPSKADKIYKEEFEKNYRIYAIPLPQTLTLAGEPVPMHLYYVKEQFDRELLINSYWQSQTVQFFKRANRYFPIIEPILAENNIPDDFKYLALIESGLMNVVSPAGATGFWQILDGTGKDLGLEINSYVDERYHLEKATIAACKYISDSKEKYGSWILAAASYNMGNRGLDRQLDKQKVSNYFDLHLNEETSRYVFRILALKYIFENPAQSGFHFREQDLYPELDYKIVTVDTTINDLVDFAFKFNTTYREIKLLNPWIRQYEIPNKGGKVYEIKVPKI
ncbi:MAG: lytic transglycosylase domain-containing protein [Bacteroidales bacterium]